MAGGRAKPAALRDLLGIEPVEASRAAKAPMRRIGWD